VAFGGVLTMAGFVILNQRTRGAGEVTAAPGLQGAGPDPAWQSNRISRGAGEKLSDGRVLTLDEGLRSGEVR